MLILTTSLLLSWTAAAAAPAATLAPLCAPAPLLAPFGARPLAQQEAPTQAEHPLEAEARVVEKIVAELVADKGRKLKTTQSKDGRVLLHTDYRSKREPKKVLENAADFLHAMDWYLGPYQPTGKEKWKRDDRPMQILILREEQTYFDLVDAIIAAAPRHQASLGAARERNGFTIYPAKLRVYFRHVVLEGMMRLEHALPHDLIHLEMHRRYGHLPNWIPEAVACAVEEQLLQTIHGDWYTDGMVLQTAHGGWRGTDTRTAMDSGKLAKLYEYTGKPYDTQVSHIAYGFAVYALETHPAEFDALCKAAQARYDEKPEEGGLFRLGKGELRQMAMDAFGAGFHDRLVEWWQKAPKRPNLKKPRPKPKG